MTGVSTSLPMSSWTLIPRIQVDVADAGFELGDLMGQKGCRESLGELVLACCLST